MYDSPDFDSALFDLLEMQSGEDADNAVIGDNSSETERRALIFLNACNGNETGDCFRRSRDQ